MPTRHTCAPNVRRSRIDFRLTDSVGAALAAVTVRLLYPPARS